MNLLSEDKSSAEPKRPVAQDLILNTPAPSLDIAGFLDDASFRAIVNSRVKTIMMQTIAKEPITLETVETDLGAKILTFYAMRKHDIRFPDPARSMGRHDMKGEIVWEAKDPLYSDTESVLASLALISRITSASDKLIGSTSPLLFVNRDLFESRDFATRLLEVDGFNWIFISDALKRDPNLALLAIKKSLSVFRHILSESAKPPITSELAIAAVEGDGRELANVPKTLFDDNLVTIAINHGGGSALPIAARYLGVKVWDNTERTLKAIEQSPTIIRADIPKAIRETNEYRAILLRKLAELPILLAPDIPDALMTQDDFVDVLIALLPKRPNLYSWLNPAVQQHPRILASQELHQGRSHSL